MTEINYQQLMKVFDSYVFIVKDIKVKFLKIKISSFYLACTPKRIRIGPGLGIKPWYLQNVQNFLMISFIYIYIYTHT